MMRVKAGEIAVTDAAGHDRDVIDVGLGDHRAHCRGNVAGGEFAGRMHLP